jgi:TPR repeat protein
MSFRFLLKTLLLSAVLMLQAWGSSAQAADAQIHVWLKQVEKIWTSNFINMEDRADKFHRLYVQGNLVAGLYMEENSSGEQKKRWADINATNGVVALVRRAADEGDAVAQAVMGDIHWDPLAKFTRDFSESSKWYLKSANQNNVSGMEFLAITSYEMQKYEDAAQWFSKAAAKGSARAQNDLGNLYYDGKGVKQDYAEAANWYRKAAEQGYAGAQNHLGNLYYSGDGVKQDYGEAANWYRKAAEQGYARAQNNLGEMYYVGKGVKQNHAEAANWYRKAAEQGYARAQNNLGYLYDIGIGIKQNDVEAANWYRKAAEQGHATAKENLAKLSKTKEQANVDGDLAAIRRAAEQGDVNAQNDLGNRYYSGDGVKEDYVEAGNWYRKAAGQGNAAAQRSLGLLYHVGLGVEKDYAEAVKWYRKAAEQGHANAQFNLGDMYKDGKGVQQDIAEAVKWYVKAAKQGDDNAQITLYNMTRTEVVKFSFTKGKEVIKKDEKQDEEAVKWNIEAAKQGYAEAQNYLGYRYYSGVGVKQNYAEAENWYRKAAEQGNANAQKNLSIISEAKNQRSTEDDFAQNFALSLKVLGAIGSVIFNNDPPPSSSSYSKDYAILSCTDDSVDINKQYEAARYSCNGANFQECQERFKEDLRRQYGDPAHACKALTGVRVPSWVIHF